MMQRMRNKRQLLATKSIGHFMAARVSDSKKGARKFSSIYRRSTVGGRKASSQRLIDSTRYAREWQTSAFASRVDSSPTHKQ